MIRSNVEQLQGVPGPDRKAPAAVRNGEFKKTIPEIALAFLRHSLRCLREIAIIEAELRGGNPDVEGLC
jgi:hypothetical protein